MPKRRVRTRRALGKSMAEAVSAVGWNKLLLWSAIAAIPVVLATNLFRLVIETLLPPGAARSAELLPYFGGVFLATMLGQLLGPYAALRHELSRLIPADRVWFGANNPLSRLNRILWNMGAADESSSFRSCVASPAHEDTDYHLDKGRTNLLTAVSNNLESVPKLFHVQSVSRSDVPEFGPAPSEESLLSLARGLRHVGWGEVELRPSWEWVVYPPSSIAVSFLLVGAMIVLLARIPTGVPGADQPGFTPAALAVQSLFYFMSTALFMLISAGRPSGIIRAALPTGRRADDLDEALALARDPFERMRLFLGALPIDDQKALLEATHYALWRALRARRTRSRVRAPHP